MDKDRNQDEISLRAALSSLLSIEICLALINKASSSWKRTSACPALFARLRTFGRLLEVHDQIQTAMGHRWTKRGISSNLAALKHVTDSISEHGNMKSRCALLCGACFRLKSARPQSTRLPPHGNALQPAPHCLHACAPLEDCLRSMTKVKLGCHTCPAQKPRLW